jgi:hypothetical protein
VKLSTDEDRKHFGLPTREETEKRLKNSPNPKGRNSPNPQEEQEKYEPWSGFEDNPALIHFLEQEIKKANKKNK